MCCKKRSQFLSWPSSLEKLTAIQAAVVQHVAQAMHSHQRASISAFFCLHLQPVTHIQEQLKPS